MAREVLLRLAIRNYERAREVAGQVMDRAQRTLTAAKGITAELRADLERARQLAETRSRAAALGARGAAASGRDVQALEGRAFRGLFGPLGQARERGESLARILGGDLDPSRALSGLMTGVAPFVPGVGAFLALLAPITDKLLGQLEERLERELKAREQRLLARLDEERFLADYARRLAEDPRFAREQARLALEQTLAEEAGRGRRVERSTAELVTDFGL